MSQVMDMQARDACGPAHSTPTLAISPLRAGSLVAEDVDVGAVRFAVRRMTPLVQHLTERWGEFRIERRRFVLVFAAVSSRWCS
jgi:hypothetical protein